MVEMKKLYKKNLVVNGQKLHVLVTGDEMLVDVIRKQLGLTGTKVGCRLNQCGICNVIVDGKVVRSCMTKISRVADNAEITTVEGVGTPENLHPIQQAFIKHGSSQCGFCIPGFVVSAYALLQQNLNPTREEVRDWFKKNRNACRCTGYKPIVDAVMDAAKVMRGEMDIEELKFHMPEDGRIFGTDYPRPSAAAKATGTFDYGADTGLKMPPGVLQIALVQSKVNHANILSIDTAEAEKMPGVEAVLTHKDVKGTNRIDGLAFYPDNHYGDAKDRPILCDEKIFQLGDAIAIVCADTVEHARAAADKVVVNIEELPAYMTAREAVADDAIEIHPGTPNIFYEQNIIKGEDPEETFKRPDVVTVEADYYTQRQPHLVLEPDVAYAYYDEEGRVTIHSKSVGVYMHRWMIMEGVGLEEDQIRIIQNNAGATFGYKLSPTIEAILCVAVMATGKPVFLDFTMEQQIVYTGKRSPLFAHIKMGATKDGKMLAVKHDMLMDHGAYSEFGDLLMTKPIQFCACGYDIPSFHGHGAITFTNHAYGAAMRAFGAPQGHFAGESIIDEMAAKLGIDAFEFRYKNLYNENSTTTTGNKPDVLVLKGLMDLIKPHYDEALKKKAEFDTSDGKKFGVGLSLSIYCCGDDGFDTSQAAVELLPDGKVALFNTWEDHGQGSDMGALATVQEGLKELHLRPEDIVLISNDTAKCENSGNAAGSRSQVMVGNAIFEACSNLLKAMRKEDGTLRTYDEMIADGIDVHQVGEWSTGDCCTPADMETFQFTPYPAYMYGVYTSEVVVDTKTGKTQVTKMVGAYDIGKICNKTVVEGQIYGGMAQGIGMALTEDFEDFKKQTTLAKCGFPTIDMIPDDLHVLFTETPRPNSAYGCSGVGEVTAAGPHCSIINAIFNACGARVRELPAYPERVLAAMPK